MSISTASNIDNN